MARTSRQRLSLGPPPHASLGSTGHLRHHPRTDGGPLATNATGLRPGERRLGSVLPAPDAAGCAALCPSRPPPPQHRPRVALAGTWNPHRRPSSFAYPAKALGRRRIGRSLRDRHESTTPGSAGRQPSLLPRPVGRTGADREATPDLPRAKQATPNRSLRAPARSQKQPVARHVAHGSGPYFRAVSTVPVGLSRTKRTPESQ